MKGRGALSQPPGRFDKLTRTLEHDGWYEEEPPNKLETIVLPEPALSGASAVLVALRTHTPTDEAELATVGVHTNVLLALQFCATVHVEPLEVSHLY